MNTNTPTDSPIYYKPPKDMGRFKTDLVTSMVTSDGETIWTRNGKLHRDGDLPAVIGNDGTKSCFGIFGRKPTRAWYRNGQLHRDGDKPAHITHYGAKMWYKNGKRHREGGLPAIVHTDGTKEWYVNGKKHRLGGPAFSNPGYRGHKYHGERRERGRYTYHVDGTEYASKGFTYTHACEEYRAKLAEAV